jgi:predicted LPLAT superfamily acyltransferase
LRFIHTTLGRRAVSLLLLPTIVYFLCLRPVSRRASINYLRKHYTAYPQQWSGLPGWWQAAKHFREFAETVVDKLLSWSIELDADQFVLAAPTVVEKLLKDDRGQLIIGSHFGNLEYCRGFMHRYKDRTINILVHDKHSQNYTALMQQLNPESRLNIFQVEDFDIPTMLRIKQKVDAGEWVFIAGDRTPVSGSERTVPVKFFGETTHLPIGPYMLAKGLGCPVKLMFSYRNYHQRDTSVHFNVIEFAEKIQLDRQNRQQDLQRLAQTFADHLQAQCKVAPYQWFNFYDFWADDPTAAIT